MTVGNDREDGASLFMDYDRESWRALVDATPLPLTELEIERLRGLGDILNRDEVETVYQPLSRLLNLYVGAAQQLWSAQRGFLGSQPSQVPFVIAVAGSVAVGKSTTSRLLTALLARWPHHPRVELVTTDGFLHSNATLIERNLLQRKGFPESYDRRALVRFLAQLKAGQREIGVPVYSHHTYDVVPDGFQVIDQPDILVLEGLNVLQHGLTSHGRTPRVLLSDFIDFSVYVDAHEADIKRWYVERFLTLRRTAFTKPGSYFQRYADLPEDQAEAVAAEIWSSVNGPNLEQNIAPTRSRAKLVLRKGPDHSVRSVRLRRL
ncbi:type I pantothenate kinase [soil metagenome]